MDEENGAWLTYAEAGQRLGVSAESVRAKAIRKGWRRQSGNDGRTRVLLPLDERTAGQQPVNARSTPVRKAVDPALVNALESHIKTLQGDNDALREQLAASEARGERLAADYAAREAKSAAELDAERERADKAIAAFVALADRLDALAAERSKPWWRRLVG